MNHQHLYMDIAEGMVDRLDFFQLTPTSILLLDLDEESIIHTLQSLYPAASISALAMSDANGQLGPTRLKLPKDAYDLMLWHMMPTKSSHLESVLSQLSARLKYDGVFMSTSLGPECFTLVEDKNPEKASSEALNAKSIHALGDMLAATGFRAPVMDKEQGVETFQSKATMQKVREAFLNNMEPSIDDKQAGRQNEEDKEGKHELSMHYEFIYGAARGDVDKQALVQQDEQGRRFIPIKNTK